MEQWSNTSNTGSPTQWRGLAFAIVVVTCTVMLFFTQCDTEHAPADLKQAANVIRWELRPRTLSHSAFSVAFPHGAPSDWIDFRTSDLGAAERGFTEEEAERDPTVREQARAIRAPLLPRGVRILSWEADKEGGRQIVLRSDNANNKVIVEGYTDPATPPVLRRTYTLPRVVPAPGVRAAYEAEHGKSVQENSPP